MTETNKKLVFDNIALLLKESGKKIGELENEAGVSAGYISRTKDSTAKPGIDFIASAAHSLHVSVDTLLNVDLSAVTPTERYIVNFLEKMKKDTVDDKLVWERETARQLESLEVGQWERVDHPLFSYETFYEEGENEYPEEVSRVVFISHSFDVHTGIEGDCYNLRLKNGTRCYLMNITKSAYRIADEKTAKAKEVWMVSSNGKAQFLCGTKDISPIADLVDDLYTAVSIFAKHVKIDPSIKGAIDAFMVDDLMDDLLDNEIPF